MQFKKKESKTGSELFEINSPKASGNGGTYPFRYDSPFDLDFIIRDDVEISNFTGPAIYAIEFEDDVIYIGKYRPDNSKLISTRWVKHIMTFTNRGYRVGGNALKKLVNKEFVNYEFKGDFLAQIENYFAVSNEGRFRDTGTVTSFNRLRFAEEYTNKQGKEKIDIGCFRFHSFTLQGTKENLSQRKEIISIIEQMMISKYKPKCNKEYTIYKECKERINIADVQIDLSKSLNNILAVLCSK